MRALRHTAAICLLLAVGCATHIYGETLPGADLTTKRRIHVERHAKDEQRVDQMIVKRLARSGFEACRAAADELERPEQVEEYAVVVVAQVREIV